MPFLTFNFRKRGIQPTAAWFEKEARKSEDGEKIPIVDIFCKMACALSPLPLFRCLELAGIWIFSIHTICEDTGYSMTFNLFRRATPARREK